MDNYISSTGRYIYITPNYKVINPTHDAPIYRYQGAIDNYDFKNQKKNFELIQGILNRLNEPLTFIYVGKFMGEYRQKISFLAHNENRNIWWRKYESGKEGGLENIIYDNGKKYSLKSWINKNQ